MVDVALGYCYQREDYLQKTMSRRNWQRNELLLALNLYCKLPFGRYHGRNPEIIRLAEFINRTPDAVAMKLSNFASLDPYHQQRGVAGLANTSKADLAVWEEFHSNWTSLATESEQIYLGMTSANIADTSTMELSAITGNEDTEATRQIKVRIGQSFFRTVILTSYHQRCCICGLPVPDMLIASHIVPWRDAEKQRLNPHNGLCLCALHDRGFDRGFMTISADYTIIIGSGFDQYLPNEAIQIHFAAYHGQEIQLPDKFIPDQNLLSIHRENYFKG